MPSNQRTGVFLAATGMLLVSLDSLGIRLADVASWDAAFWFGVFTALAMAVLVRWRMGRSVVAMWRDDGRPSVVSGVLQAASTTLFIVAINTTTVANTVVIIAAAPVLAAVAARALIGERTPLRVWLAIAASFAGIIIVMSGSVGRGRLAGDLAAVGAIIAFALNLTVWRRYPSVNRMAVIGLGGLVMALLAAIPANPFDVPPKSLAILAVLGAVAGPAGRVAVAAATRYLPTSQVSLFTPVETIAATAWAWIFLDEFPPAATFVGGAIVLAAVAYGAIVRPGGRVAASPVTP